jgi:hypothetical protein
MTELLFDDEYYTLSYVQFIDFGYLYLEWKEATQHLDDHEYRHHVVLYRDLVVQHGCSCVLVNTRQFLYTIPLDTQEWINSKIFPDTVEAGLRKMAIIPSDAFYASLSVEQTMTENPEMGFTSCFFVHETDAIAWLRG